MGQILTCCQSFEEKYDLIDHIYDASESQLMLGAIREIITGKFDIKGVIFESIRNDVRYCFVENECGEATLLRKLMIVSMGELIPDGCITMINMQQIDEFDVQAGQSRTVFVYLDPPEQVFTQNQTQGIDIFVFHKHKAPILLSGIKVLIETRLATIMYRI